MKRHESTETLDKLDPERINAEVADKAKMARTFFGNSKFAGTLEDTESKEEGSYDAEDESN